MLPCFILNEAPLLILVKQNARHKPLKQSETICPSVQRLTKTQVLNPSQNPSQILLKITAGVNRSYNWSYATTIKVESSGGNLYRRRDKGWYGSHGLPCQHSHWRGSSPTENKPSALLMLFANSLKKFNEGSILRKKTRYNHKASTGYALLITRNRTGISMTLLIKDFSCAIKCLEKKEREKT